MSDDRYNRQVLVPFIGEEGQQRIATSRVVLLGCGALGTAAANVLARAGVGELLIVDRDFVERSNLQRQVLFDEADAHEGLPKAVAAERRLRAINSTIRIEGRVADAHPGNVEELIRGATTVVDATDNFETRFLLNDACVKLNIPWIYGGAVGVEGMTMTILPDRTPCLRCVFDSAPPPGLHPTCETAGVLAGATNIIGSWQANEALKICVGRLDDVKAQLLSINLWTCEVNAIALDRAKTADCPCCGLRRFEYLDAQATSTSTTLCGREAVQINPSLVARLDLAELARKLTGAAGVLDLVQNPFLLRCRVPGSAGSTLELAIFADGRAIVKGTKDATVARAAYAKYVGV
jgi:molybdopterin-synthase adenylyltransferase